MPYRIVFPGQMNNRCLELQWKYVVQGKNGLGLDTNWEIAKLNSSNAEFVIFFV